jgi:AcrR family transcriptional regulator
MARPKGSRNQDYEETRRSILTSLRRRLMSAGGATASFRELAASVELNPATLRHYFPSREALLEAAFADMHEAGARFISEGATSDRGGARESLRWFLEFFWRGWSASGLNHMHVLGLTAGLGDARLGQAYLGELLEPSLQSAEARIARHVAQGELGPCDIRHAALELVSPFMFALLHQDSLSGEGHRPLALREFLDDHLERFLRAHAPVTDTRTARPRRAPGVKKATRRVK